MNYGGLIEFDTGNSHGLSTTLFIQGCSNHCEGCHNPSTWNPYGGKEFIKEIEDRVIESLKNPHIQYFVLSGGDPFYPDNVVPCMELVKRIKQETNVEIIVYTGYTWELLRDRNDDNVRSFLHTIDYLIDGKYEINNPTPERDLRGSLNQRCFKRADKGWVDYSNQYFKSQSAAYQK